MDLSKAAKDLICCLFFSGEKAHVRSHAPHAFFEKNRAAFEELLAAGLITSEPHDHFGVTEYTGTERCEEIWREHGHARLEQVLG